MMKFIKPIQKYPLIHKNTVLSLLVSIKRRVNNADKRKEPVYATRARFLESPFYFLNNRMLPDIQFQTLDVKLPVSSNFSPLPIQ